MKQGRLFIISGPSGVGKDTIADAQLRLPMGEGRVKKLPTYTTRRLRKGEREGRQYYFVSKPEFKKLLQNSRILEHNFYNQNYYGTAKKDLEDALKNGFNVILTIDIHGGLNIKKKYHDACLIFIKSKLSDIKTRLLARGANTTEEIEKRLKIARKELKYQKDYDYIVENPEGHPEKAIEEVKKIIREETCTQ